MPLFVKLFLPLVLAGLVVESKKERAAAAVNDSADNNERLRFNSSSGSGGL